MIVGIDEVGRGCWAGPLVAGAVALPNDFVLDPASGWKLDDSKKLSARQRRLAVAGLQEYGARMGLGWVTAAEVDGLGLTAAVALAMRRAYHKLIAGLDENIIDQVVIDGAINYLPDVTATQAVIKADGSLPAVSAASIVAKEARDNWMRTKAHADYPSYGFDRHVGYGTPQHLAALRTWGLTILHRKSYNPVRRILETPKE